MYETLALYIDGEFIAGDGRIEQEVRNPATLEVLGRLPHATPADLDRALQAAARAFESWKNTPALERSRILRRVAELTRERASAIGRNITLDQGKPLPEAVAEVLGCAEHAEWHAEEGRRIYGRILPARQSDARLLVMKEPVGVSAAFTPWNFPFNQAIRKIAAALGAGCTLILKGPEESPSAIVALARLFHDAGLPPGVLNIVWGVPGEVAQYLIGSPIVQHVSFTGSVPVGRQLAALAGAGLKRLHLELGGHAPALVFPDANIEGAAELLARFKIRNAGQVCISPSRFFVHESVHDRFVERFVQVLKSIKVGNGLDEDVAMGPLANERRLAAARAFIEDARQKGAQLAWGAKAPQGQGYFHAPVALTEVPQDALLLREEPFAPIAPILAFSETDAVIRQANALPYGLAGYVFTNSLRTAQHVSNALAVGMVHVNQLVMGADIPFGGIKDSGVGSEGGVESFETYLNTKFIHQA